MYHQGICSPGQNTMTIYLASHWHFGLVLNDITVIIPPSLGEQKKDFTYKSGLEKCPPTH